MENKHPVLTPDTAWKVNTCAHTDVHTYTHILPINPCEKDKAGPHIYTLCMIKNKAITQTPQFILKLIWQKQYKSSLEDFTFIPKLKEFLQRIFALTVKFQ